MTKGYSREKVLKAVTGCGGVVQTVAQRLGCSWKTAKRYIDKWTSTREAFEAELETILDIAESVLFRNIRVAYQAQRVETDHGIEYVRVDLGDVKWLLSRKGKDRGYDQRQQVAGTGPDGSIPVDHMGAAVHIYIPDNGRDGDDPPELEDLDLDPVPEG